MPITEHQLGSVFDDQWDALLRAPITSTECAFLNDAESEDEQIVVIYNARNAPPIVTIDVSSDQSLVTLKADGAPLAVMSRHANHVPRAADVLLVARHTTFSA